MTMVSVLSVRRSHPENGMPQRRFPMIYRAAGPRFGGGGRRWAYPELFITADAGGSNGYRLRAWKQGLQQFADDTGVRVHVSHFPPGTSKSRLSTACLSTASKPLRTFETIVDLIGNTRTES